MPTPATAPRAGRRARRGTDACRWALAALCAPLSGCSGWAEGHWSEAAVVAMAIAAIAGAWMVASRRYSPPPRMEGRHVAVHLPMLAPGRYCACGSCGQLAAPGAWLADWHYDVPGVLAPAKAPDAIAIQGLAWSLGPGGTWEPAIVYVLPPDAHAASPEARPPSVAPAPVPSTNGQAHHRAHHQE